MAKHDYDKILTRLVGILARLFSGERVRTKALAQEYNVSIRTIQKDMRRLECFPIQGGYAPDYEYYLMDGFSFARAEGVDSGEIALLSLALDTISDISDEFELLKKSIFSKLIMPNMHSPVPYYIKHEYFQSIDTTSRSVDTLEDAIVGKKAVLVEYKGCPLEVEPYKIVSFEGIWYLLCRDRSDRRFKNLFLYLINSPQMLEKEFVSDVRFEKLVERIHTAWFVDGVSFEVEVLVHSEIAHYFMLKKQLATQKLLEERPCGSVVLSFEVSHIEDIDNLIKSWLPHIEVLSPRWYADALREELRRYVEKI